MTDLALLRIPAEFPGTLYRRAVLGDIVAACRFKSTSLVVKGRIDDAPCRPALTPEISIAQGHARPPSAHGLPARSAGRRDLEAEAEYGALNFDDALITPDLLEDLEELIAMSLAAPAGRLVLGAPLPPRVMASRWKSKGTVLIVPGGSMSQLSDFAQHPKELMWLNPSVVTSHDFVKLKLAAYGGLNQETDADAGVQIGPDGPLPYYYDSLQALLCAHGWNTVMFPYDWRKHIENDGVSTALKNEIMKLSRHKPVHIVTHSQGGIVARAALMKLAQEITPGPAKARVGKVIMLGPASYGSFDVALAIADSIDQIPICKIMANPQEFAQRTIASFTAFYQLMPWSEQLVPSLQDQDHDVRDYNFWSNLGLARWNCARLEVAFPPRADPWGAVLDNGASWFNDQITIIVGSHPSRQTPGGVQFVGGHLEIDDTYNFANGDGWVPDVLAIIPGTTAYRALDRAHPTSHGAQGDCRDSQDSCKQGGRRASPGELRFVTPMTRRGIIP